MFDDNYNYSSTNSSSSSPSPLPSPNTAHSNNKTWQTLKEEGRNHFQNSNYTQALISFQEALKKGREQEDQSSHTISNLEKQILLSNSVACRLKIGGAEMACVAIEEAKQCIQLNDQWSKAYIRLASAYLTVGGHSNDACQALQNAIRLDPSNSTAKQMLMKELRRDDSTDPTSNRNNYSNNDLGQDGNDDDDDDDDAMYDDNDEVPRPSAPPLFDDVDIDDTPTFIQRIQNYLQRTMQWYQHEASDGWKSLVKVVVVMLVLYIAFGGRFGLEYYNRQTFNDTCRESSGGSISGGGGCRMGNYGQGNAYDQFYNSGRKTTNNRSSGNSRSQYDSGNYNTRDSYNSNQYNYNDDYGYGGNSYGHGSSRTNHNRGRHRSSSDWDTFIPYIIVGVIALLMNKVFGIPIHAIPMGFGMRRGFGGFGPRIRFGGGGIGFGFGPGGGVRFGGFPRAGGVRYNRRRAWY